MVRKIVLILLLTVFVTGCSPDKIPPQQGEPQEDTYHHSEEEETGDSTLSPDIKENSTDNEITDDTGTENRGEASGPAESGETGNTGELETEQYEEVPIISKEETALMFINAWKEMDLEKMDMLTYKPLEEFFYMSDILFASYYYLRDGDLAGFIRDGIETLKVYDQDAFEDIQAIQLPGDKDSLVLKMGNSFQLDFNFVLDESMWKLEMMDSLPVQVTRAVPEDWGSLDNMVLYDAKDVDGDGFIELLAMGYWGDWEGMGPEPSSAAGIYTYNGETFKKLFFKGIEDRLQDDRVLVEGGAIGRLTGDETLTIVFVEKSAMDEIQDFEQPDAEYFIGLYRLEDGRLNKTEEIDWMAAVQDSSHGTIMPKWLEIIGVKNFKGSDKEQVVIKAGLEIQSDGSEDVTVCEGVFILAAAEEGWKVEWSHVGTEGEYHQIIFDDVNSNGSPCKLYCMEDPSAEWEKGRIFEVSYQDGEWVESPVFEEKLDLKAVSDMDGDGYGEFLVWHKACLKVLSRQKKELWRSEELTGTREIPFAWMGNTGGEQRIYAALHQGTHVYWLSRIAAWKGTGYSLEHFWDSEELGTEGISAMIVTDKERDGEPDLMVNYSNDYLIRGQYFKMF